MKTKLYVPPLRPNCVPRPRLTEKLAQALTHPLTLISAPAGFGKTTLINEWRTSLVDHTYPLAWLSLDDDDNDAARFWAYVIAALQTLQPETGAEALVMLHAGWRQPSLPKVFLTSLINDLTRLNADSVLVLDDYHVIESRLIHDALAYWLEHLPPHLHLIIASRTDPSLPLARLRARNQLVEIRAADLRFTPEEAALFLNQVTGLELTPENVAALESRTEGWIAGLQLAAIALQTQLTQAGPLQTLPPTQSRSDVSSFIAAFTGSNRYVLDYLVEEVLRRQSESLQTFLLQTSILDQLCGPLCDAVTGRSDSQAILELLEQSNLFTSPLDEERRWYRYHHLFAEVLSLRLHRTQPDQVPELHRKAAAWYEEHQLIDDAVRHTLAADDAARAAVLVEQHVDDVLRRGEGATLRRWLAAIPQEIVRARPRLALAQAMAAFNAGHLDVVEPLLADAERALATVPMAPHEPSASEEASALANVPAAIALLRASLAGFQGAAERMSELARSALTYLSEDERGPRYAVRWNLAIADWMRGRLAEAERAFADIAAEGRVAGELHLTLSAGSLLGRVQRAQGRLGAALRTYREGLEFAARTGPAVAPSAGMAHLGMAEVFYARNQLEQALSHAAEGITLGRRLTSTQSLANGLATLAWIRQAEGDSAAALEAMDEAYQFMPNLEVVALQNPVPAERARLLLAQGDVKEAALWVKERGLEAEDEPSYPREREYFVLARVLLARNAPDKAVGLLERLGALAEIQGRVESVIEARLLQALALDAVGEHAQAMIALARALALAEPEGYVRIFLDEGAPMVRLLRQAESRTVAPAYVGELLAAFGEAASSVSPTPLLLTEPLSERELEILRLVAAGLTTQEIAEELILAVGTVRTHLKNIYGKLDAHSRVQAVEQARALKLL